MRQAGQQQHHLLRLPPTLATRHQPQGLLILAKGRFKHRAAVIGISQSHWLVVGQGRHQHRILIPALLSRSANHPLLRRATEAVGLQDGGDLPAWTRRRLPRSNGRAPLPYPSAVTDFGDPLLAPTQQPVEPLGGPKAPIQAEHNALSPLPRPAQTGFQCAQGGCERRYRRGLAPP
jgi:hypothetical protein